MSKKTKKPETRKEKENFVAEKITEVNDLVKAVNDLFKDKSALSCGCALVFLQRGLMREDPEFYEAAPRTLEMLMTYEALTKKEEKDGALLRRD